MAKLFCVSLDPALEDLIINYIDRGNDTTTLSMPPAVVNQITSAIVKELRQLIQGGHQPGVLASPQVRGHIHRLLEAPVPAVAVLGYNEISKGVEVESVGLAQVESEQESPQLQGVAQ